MAKVVTFPQRTENRQKKVVAAVQAEIEALPDNSGDWRVQGIPGLFVRAGAGTRSFRIQRRIAGKLCVKVLGEMTVTAARREAMKAWTRLKPRPVDGKMTLREAWERYLEERQLSEKTRSLYRYNLERYLSEWADRPIEAVAADRAGFRARFLAIARDHGAAVASQTLRCFRAVYHYQRAINTDLPEFPARVVKLPTIRPRDWALSDEELRRWWRAVQMLNRLKQAFWLTLLLTGARRNSVRMLRWRDVDFERRIIHFRVAKAGRTYSVPMAKRLVKILEDHKAQALPSEWVFPSPQRPGQPLAEQVRDDKRGVLSAHHLRHTMRTRLAEVGATPDLARIALGHSMSGDVSRGYITPALLVEAVRPLMDAVAERYAEILDWDKLGPTS